MSSDEGKLNHSLLNVNNIKYDLVQTCWKLEPIHFLRRNSFFLESYNYAHFQIDR